MTRWSALAAQTSAALSPRWRSPVSDIAARQKRPSASRGGRPEVSVKMERSTPMRSLRRSTSRPSASKAFTTPRAQAPETRRPEWVLGFEASLLTDLDRSTSAPRFQAHRGDPTPRVAQTVDPFVVTGTEIAVSVSFVIRCEAGTSGTERRRRVSPPSHPESGETRSPKMVPVSASLIPPSVQSGPPRSRSMTSRRPASFFVGRVDPTRPGMLELGRWVHG